MKEQSLQHSLKFKDQPKKIQSKVIQQKCNYIDPKTKVLNKIRSKNKNKNLDQKIKRVNKYFNRIQQNDEKPSDLLCPICLQLFIQPVTTSCGHTFCIRCLDETILFKPQCPSCRNPLRSSPLPQCSTLSSLLLRLSQKYPSQSSYSALHAQSVSWLQSRTPPSFIPGTLLDIRDTQFIWCQAQIKQQYLHPKTGSVKSILIHYLGWNPVYDEIIDIGSDRLARKGFYTDRGDIPRYRGDGDGEGVQGGRMYSYVVGNGIANGYNPFFFGIGGGNWGIQNQLEMDINLINNNFHLEQIQEYPSQEDLDVDVVYPDEQAQVSVQDLSESRSLSFGQQNHVSFSPNNEHFSYFPPQNFFQNQSQNEQQQQFSFGNQNGQNSNQVCYQSQGQEQQEEKQQNCSQKEFILRYDYKKFSHNASEADEEDNNSQDQIWGFYNQSQNQNRNRSQNTNNIVEEEVNDSLQIFSYDVQLNSLLNCGLKIEKVEIQQKQQQINNIFQKSQQNPFTYPIYCRSPIKNPQQQFFNQNGPQNQNRKSNFFKQKMQNYDKRISQIQMQMNNQMEKQRNTKMKMEKEMDTGTGMCWEIMQKGSNTNNNNNEDRCRCRQTISKSQVQGQGQDQKYDG